ncbi:MAG: VIT family protein [Actinomycetaceae bacterium]|nr:VIT family protein [Actinomycetaceae bacterium]
MSSISSGYSALFHAGQSLTRIAPPRSSDSRDISLSSRLNWLRAGVLGANDGIVSISGLLIGVAAAAPENTAAIAIAGAAGIASAALSMSVGEYVSVSTQRDTEKVLLHRQEEALATNPTGELHRLAHLWQNKGLSEETAARVATELSENNALEAHLSVEHQIDPDDLTNPWAAAFSSFCAFLLGALLPLLTMLLLPPPLRIPATFISVIIALGLTGWISAALGGAPKLRATARLIVGGAAAMALTYGIGHVFGIAV